MKVQVTFEVDHDDRLVIGMAEGKEFLPATREQVRDFMLRHYEVVLEPGRKKLAGFYDDLLADIKAAQVDRKE